MQKVILFFILGSTILTLASLTPFSSTTQFSVDENSLVSETLERLGDIPLPHQANLDMKGASVEVGENIVLHGFSKSPKGGKTSKQSRHFVCTSCHNIEKEDPDLSISDPQTRLEYTNKKGLPFLQGTTLYGIVNRVRFYNGDYEKKYGALVRPARRNLRESIQLCAIECSQGRALEKWEIESVLAYLWTLELRMGDLKLSESDYNTINSAFQGNVDQTETVELIQSKYLDRSPANFLVPPDNRKTGFDLEGDPENGQLVYENSCLHCHEAERYSFFNLDNSQLTFQYLLKHFPRYTRYSTYQVARYGTPPMNGKRAYMPQYTAEKMSNQQLEDLRSYIEQEAKR